MTRTLIGTDSTGAGCVKITRGSLNPVTTPDSNISAFQYNSKWAADIKFNTFESTITPPAGTNRYLPSGTNANNYLKGMADLTGGFANAEFEVCIKNAWFDYMPYDLPLYDLRWRRLSDNHYVEFNRARSSGGDDEYGREPEYYRTFDSGRSAWWKNKVNEGADRSRVLGANPGNCFYYYPYRRESRFPFDAALYETTVVVWRLPADNRPILHSTPQAPVSGQVATQITSQFLRCAKPGYDVRTAMPTQLAFDSTGRPLSVIYADDVSIAPGVSSINIGFPTTPNMLADLFPYVGSVITFPMARERRSLVLDYWFSGNSIFFDNKESSSMRVRFLVFANDESGQSSGSNNVLRNFTVNGENVVQLVRPGAAANPALRDIVVDSRWPALQIIKEGWIETKTNPNRGGVSTIQDTYDVPFDGTGLFPIVKYATYHNTPSLGEHTKQPYSAITRDYTDAFDYHQGGSTFCQISDNNARFYTHNGAPMSERVSNNVWRYEFEPAQVLGIRYYILGFPR